MDQEQIDRLVTENDRLAIWYVRRFVALPQGDPRRDDLLQAARLGLIEAARRFDPARGQFSSYAVWWMHRFVNEAKRSFHVIRLRRSVREVPVPTYVDSEMLELLGVVDEDLELRIDARRLRVLLFELNERERSLIELRWLSNEQATLREVGERLGCTREGARYIEVRALAKLKRLLSLKLTRPARRRRMAFVERRLRRTRHRSRVAGI